MEGRTKMEEKNEETEIQQIYNAGKKKAKINTRKEREEKK